MGGRRKSTAHRGRQLAGGLPDKNVGELLERLLTRYRAALPLAREEHPAGGGTSAPASDADTWPDTPPTHAAPRETRAARERRDRDDRREARYREIHALRERGYGVRAICRHLHLHQATVRRYLDAPSCPHPAPRPGRTRRIAPYLPYLRERWDTGERRAEVLWAEIRERGFPGSWRRVREQLTIWRREARSTGAAPRADTVSPPLPALPRGRRYPPRRVASWLALGTDELTPTQRAYVEALTEACPAIHAAHPLAQAFAQLIRTRDDTGLEAWLAEAEACTVIEVRDFAAGLRRDQAAVQAALDHAWNSGQVEGQINKLKLVKRSMYGRAGLPLLRRRFLLAS